MENGPFTDDFPIKTSMFNEFSMAMLNKQMVGGKKKTHQANAGFSQSRRITCHEHLISSDSLICLPSTPTLQ